MLGALAALFQYSDEIAKAIEPVLKQEHKVVEALGVKGTLYCRIRFNCRYQVWSCCL